MFAGLIVSMSALATSAHAQIDPRLTGKRMTQLEAGVNAYDLKQRNLWPEDHPDAAMVCAAALGVMALEFDKTLTTDAERANAESLRESARSWLVVSARRRGMELAASNAKYFGEAVGEMRRVDFETLTFWTQHCLALADKMKPAK
ncbi:MAG: hypothetical protein V4808_03550 [Pseudomonadota bacterium]